ncbi:MAG: uroporphyrinogen decarboxylase family protein [Syntrophomonadaceae bacterium]
MLSSRQRVSNALNLKIPDRPPKGEIFISPETVKGFPVDSLQELLLYLNADIVTLGLDKLDQHDWASWRHSRFYIFGLMNGPLSRMFKIFNWKKAFILINSNPVYTREIMKKMIIQDQELIKSALDCGCEGIIIADDLAGQHGLLFSPDYLKHYYFPIVSELIMPHPKVPFVFHSDGNIMDIIDLIRGSAFRGIHSLQPSVGISANRFANSLKSGWVFWGNYEFESTGQMKTVSQVKHEVKELLSSWSQVPGYVFGSSGGLYPGIPPETIKAAYDMVDTIGTHC